MSEESVFVTAPSVDEAVIIGLTRLAATRDEVEIEILDEGSRGFFGLGTREASVRLTRRPPIVEEELALPSERESSTVTIPESEPVVEVSAPSLETPVVKEQPASMQIVASEQVIKSAPTHGEEPEAPPRHQRSERSDGLDRALVEKMANDVAKNLFTGLNVSYSLSWEREDRPTLWVSLRGSDADMLVGPRSQTLNSVQYLFRSLLHRLADGNYNVVVDADGYRKRRQRSLESLARKLANQAVDTQRPVKMRAMPAHERRLIHILLRQDKRVKTESSGRGRDRAITIVPDEQAR